MVADITQDKTPCSCEHNTTLFWCGPGKNIPVLHFRPDVCLYKNTECSCNKLASRGVGLTYKLVKTECRLLRQLLEGHGFREVHQTSNDFNVMWCGCHVKPYTLRGLTELQKVNHFPRSYEITRKDRLYKNFMRMRQTMGAKHYDFLPVTFVLPSEVNDFYSTFQREKGYWIAKPVASSRGRGISIISHPNQVNLEEQTVVCKYISNPLLVDGFKFDLRIYVMVTSFDPLRVYIFNEGLARFSTVRYDGSQLNLDNMFMHLTNYSINKKNQGYVKCSDPDIEDYGNKWSMSALLRYLKNEGFDTATMMMKVEDMIVKTLLSAEIPIANACRMFLPHRENCFELFGFDVIFDDDSKPWLLEVNLSPSLACESPLDLKIKSNLVSHMLTLAGVVALDPYSKRDNGVKRKSSAKGPYSLSVDGTNAAPLSNEDLRLVRQTKEEFVRKGAFSRIFPTEDSWDLYCPFLENKTHFNFMLHSQLYPNRFPFTHRARDRSRPSSAVVSMNKFREINTGNSKLMNYCTIYSGIRERYRRYEKSLQPLGTVEDYPPEALIDAITPDFSLPDDLTSDTTRDTDTVDETSSDLAVAKKKDKAAQDRSKPIKGRLSKSTTDLVIVEEDAVDIPDIQQDTSDEQRPPLPVFNPQEIIERASSLSKVQAREVFATYLGKLQESFNEDTDTEEKDKNDEFYEEQMDTVVKFLKRASTNLHLQVFRVIVPSKKLPLSDRRRILAKELGDFVQIYSKETDQLAQKVRMRRLLLQSRDDHDQVDAVDLHNFLSMVSERDLEELLTSYSKTHPSSALFFGELKHQDLNSLMRGNVKRKLKEREKVSLKEEDSVSAEFTDKCTISSTVNLTTNAAVNENQKDSCGLAKSSSCGKYSVSTTSSGYGSYKSSSSSIRPKSARPNTVASRRAIDDALSRLNKRSGRKVAKNPDTQLADQQGRILKRSSMSGLNTWSPYNKSVSTSTIASIASAPPSRTTSRVTQQSRAASRIPPAGRAKSAKSRGEHKQQSTRPRMTKTQSDNALVVSRGQQKTRDVTSRDVTMTTRDPGVASKTAAQLKNPRSKRFVQSVWTKEFCKLMDLRMYSH